ncbi:hypothetical protein EDI_050000 [Entamoeba dispar SAW760]|uniref:DUF676 domain-containing protein n=1 Tax=Entamoeba dispar (strain ATCC PRA-260 / SAW760) TaxID=370354 RepID=B0EK13_ENTDS|nr:uncharacterized protein EDI_050000 [Entamoeba dispar SAW760]EDR25140.1 hypothetical protein EDI_050000 [Entamoeba dispar SAW760]|eukprot:EDR25140.1 hypothetical protein EDI_050000 [Entamoeba dispar SAW760]
MEGEFLNNKSSSVVKKENVVNYFFFENGIALSIEPKEYWAPFVDGIKKELKTNYIIKYCSCNSLKSKTSDGIEVGALRLANEICNDLKDTKSKRGDEKYKIHFIGHSLGGVYFRLAIPILFNRNIFNNPNYIPFSFITLESPHAGVKKSQTGFKPFFGNVFEGETLNELELNDRPFPPYDPLCLDEYPLLLRMVEDDVIAPLKKFKHLTLVQNIRASPQVPYVSSALDRAIPYDRDFLQDQFLLDGFDFLRGYNDIVDGCTKHYQLQNEHGDIFEERVDGCIIHDRIIKQLNTLNWRRLNVHFRTKSNDAHIFIMGQMNRKKLFKNWGNEDVERYLDVIAKIIKRDIDIENNTAEINPSLIEEVNEPIKSDDQPFKEEKLIDIPQSTQITQQIDKDQTQLL